VEPALTRDDAIVVLPPGSTLLLYTDGLIERPGEDINRGLTRLRQHGASLAGLPLQEFCDTARSGLGLVCTRRWGPPLTADFRQRSLHPLRA
jgi:serine phosphatase RsbU (regulator of sigma subunit)